MEKLLKKKTQQQHGSWKSLPWLPKYMDEKINWIPDLPMTPQLVSTGNKRESGFSFLNSKFVLVPTDFTPLFKSFPVERGPG